MTHPETAHPETAHPEAAGNDKSQILDQLRAEFKRWENLLSRLHPEQITEPQLSAGLSVKDVVVHVWAWQQLSIARLEAGLENRPPDFHLWPPQWDPETDVDDINAWIYATYREKPWAAAYAEWREGFLRFLTLAEQIPEADLLNPQRYPWLHGWPLLAVLQGSYEHHHIDHLQPLLQQFGHADPHG